MSVKKTNQSAAGKKPNISGAKSKGTTGKAGGKTTANKG